MGFFDEFANELASELTKGIKKAAIEGMRGKPLDDDEDIDSLSLGAEVAKEIIKSAKEDPISPPKKNTADNFCEDCGAKLHVNAKFCSKCGIKIASCDDDDYEEEDDYGEDEEDNEDEDEEEDGTINGLFVKEKILSIEIKGSESDIIALISSNDLISETDIEKYNLEVNQDSPGDIIIYTNYGDEKFKVLSTFGRGSCRSELSRREIDITEYRYQINDNGKIIDCTKSLKPFIQKILIYLNTKINNKDFFLSYATAKYHMISKFDQLITLIDEKLLNSINPKEIQSLNIFTNNYVDINALQNGRDCCFVIKANVPSCISLGDALDKYTNPRSVKSKEEIFITYINISPSKKSDLLNTRIDLTTSHPGFRNDEFIDIMEPFKPIIERFKSILENL